jgi:nitrite reductase (NO-forming)
VTHPTDTPDPDERGAAPAAPDDAGRAGAASRRSFLRRAGLGTAAMFGGGFAGGFSAHAANHALAATEDPSTQGAHGLSVYDAAAPGGSGLQVVGGAPGTAAAGVYGHGAQPPLGLSPAALDRLTHPPARQHGPRTYTMEVVEHPVEVADGVVVAQWTYNGSAPGPILRVTEGERLTVHLRNRTEHDHNLHLHGRHSPQMDGWEPIPPGGEFTYEVVAAPAGVHPYHCHTMPLAQHVARGLYGALIVDPVEPRPEAVEVVLVLSGWDVDGDGRNELYTWNGIAGFYHRHPITVPVGALVRVHVLNLVEYDSVASFHLHAQTFDVFRTGTSTTPQEHTDTVTLTQGERAVLEFRLPERGRYMFHPHQHHMAEAGAMGWFSAV